MSGQAAVVDIGVWRNLLKGVVGISEEEESMSAVTFFDSVRIKLCMGKLMSYLTQLFKGVVGVLGKEENFESFVVFYDSIRCLSQLLSSVVVCLWPCCCWRERPASRPPAKCAQRKIRLAMQSITTLPNLPNWFRHDQHI